MQCLGTPFDHRQVAGVECGFHLADQCFDLAYGIGIGWRRQSADRLARGMQLRFALVARFGQEAQRVVGLGVLFRVQNHGADLAFRQARIGLDLDAILLAGSLVFCADMQDAVGVDIETDIDLRLAARCRRNAFETELAEGLVACCNLAFALKYLDRHGRLVIVGR